ncbi:MAG TPA: acyl-CoA dehydrogenase C-terminal domain-containing protein [Candidatus Polarisedimenticolia bacterium]|nr:acyl-CoA dehydrogenase C-terminal domain-containing protein [Candidatus Polarisedimenticolia bacterium]
MTPYQAPLADMRFVLEELHGSGDIAKLPGYEEATPDLIAEVLEAAGTFMAEKLQPLNRVGDEEGCHLENGVVRTPRGFKDAYKAFVEGGWVSLAGDKEFGGQGLPQLVNIMVEEMICSTNLSFGMYPGLSQSAYNALRLHGSDELKQHFLPKLADGSWAGTMCLTEPQCGTDLGLVRTRAEPAADGSYRITGGKIFITAGEHDLTENILHLVLARLPDAPSGTRGITLFLVPKIMADGKRNGVSCGRVEEKMGVHGVPACAINFDGAAGWLVGKPNKGMSAMFTMMNAARLAVGVQGLGLAEAAYQGARDYARTRLQGRSLAGAKFPDQPADPLIVHPDIRRMLMTIRARVEGCRALAGWVGRAADEAAKHPDADKREEAEDLLALLTPIVKAHFTDTGFDCANLAVQIWGGHGYIRDNGMEQFVRDARITQIYEGTNGIQALDLIGRKLGLGTGRLLRRFFHPVAAFIEEAGNEPAMAEFILPLAKVFARLQQVTAQIAQAGLKDPEEAAAAANDYLNFFALTALAYLWARMARIALAKADNDPAGFYKAKLMTARFFMARLLPQQTTLFQTVGAGKATLMDMPAEAF